MLIQNHSLFIASDKYIQFVILYILIFEGTEKQFKKVFPLKSVIGLRKQMDISHNFHRIFEKIPMHICAFVCPAIHIFASNE